MPVNNLPAPHFQRLLDVLARRPTERPVLFEFVLNPNHRQRLAGPAWIEESGPSDVLRNWVNAYHRGGYDFSVVAPWDLGLMEFKGAERASGESIGMAHGGVIVDRESFESYEWPDPEADDWSFLDAVRPHVPDGMKLLVACYCGVLENLTKLMGYEELCYTLVEDPDLFSEITDAIGLRLYRYYERAMQNDLVGGIIVNDDWGFKTQTFLSPEQMRRYIIPWHKQIVALAHKNGRPAILHSCGNLGAIWEDIIEDIGYDGKHSYEDAILPPEEAYRQFGDRIAILGGLDVDYLCRSTPAEIRSRASAILDQTAAHGGYALGSGNSIAEYVPYENYDALRYAALDRFVAI